MSRISALEIDGAMPKPFELILLSEVFEISVECLHAAIIYDGLHEGEDEIAHKYLVDVLTVFTKLRHLDRAALN